MSDWIREQELQVAGRAGVCFRSAVDNKSAEALLPERVDAVLNVEDRSRMLTELTTFLLSGPVVEEKSGADGPTTGRSIVQRVRINKEYTAIIRRGVRGGIFGPLLGNTYFRFPSEDYRVFSELLILDHLFASGVAVPVGLAAIAVRGRLPFSYRAAIATQEIPDAKNLLLLAREKESQKKLAEYSEAAGREARKMLAAGVFHTDLHLANILTNGAAVHLIDFDNARRIPVEGGSADNPSLSRYSDRLLQRFRRFAVKYGVYPDAVSAAFSSGLGSA